MTDIEMLGLAAKAAGLSYIKPTEDYSGSLGLCLCDEHGRPVMDWRPLTDDGDALRLAVSLRLWVQVNDRCAAWAQQDGESILGPAAASAMVMFSDENSDPRAATRRAIVRAAAEIGRNMG